MGSPQTGNIENEIRALIAEILEIRVEQILPDTMFVEELGMDSMMALEILASVEKKYKMRIPEEYLPKVTSLRSMLAIAKNILGSK